MARLSEAAEAKKDDAEGAALLPLVRAVEAAWTQDPLLRPGLEDMYVLLCRN